MSDDDKQLKEDIKRLRQLEDEREERRLAEEEKKERRLRFWTKFNLYAWGSLIFILVVVIAFNCN